MLHPLFSTIVQRPDLVMDHLSAYGALLNKEASSAGSELLARVVAGLVAILALVVFLTMTGTALMLGFMLVVAVMIAKKPLKSEKFPELKAQIESDTRALHSVA